MNMLDNNMSWDVLMIVPKTWYIQSSLSVFEDLQVQEVKVII